MFHSQIDRNTLVSTPSPAPVVPAERRGKFGQLLEIAGVPAGQILGKFRACLPGSWIVSVGNSGYTALNSDLYGYCPVEAVAVVQLREILRQKAGYYPAILKSYVLVGKGEITGEPFCHGVSAQAVHAAIRKHAGKPDCAQQVVHAAQRWIFQLTEKQHAASVRQGDVIMFPVPKPKQTVGLVSGPVLIGGSHQLRSPEVIQITKGEDYLARDPALWHTKAQHDPTYAPRDGWYRVRQARREATYEFAPQYGD